MSGLDSSEGQVSTQHVDRVVLMHEGKSQRGGQLIKRETQDRDISAVIWRAYPVIHVHVACD